MYTSIDYTTDSGGNTYVSAYASDPEPDDTAYEDWILWQQDGPPTWELFGDDYDLDGTGSSFSTSDPVPTDDTYTASFTFVMEYLYVNDSGSDGGCELSIEDGSCEAFDFPYGDASIYVPDPPPRIYNINPSSVNQGDQGTLTLTGADFIENSTDQLTLNFSGSGNPFTPTGTPTATMATYSYDFTGYAPGTYTLSVTNNEASSDNKFFTVLPVQPPFAPPVDPCAVSSDPKVGYTSIASTGTTGSTGTMAVSFSGAAFAAVSPTVTYGPYSTPSSIAASVAALITKNYYQYGLSAKAFGPNIVYSGFASLGTVSNVITGPSFTTHVSSAAATEAESSCESAPPPPPAGLSCSSVTRGGTTRCVANGGAVSNWSFTDGTNTVTRTDNLNSPTWSGVMATSGTVSVTVGSARKTASITVSPRSGWAFTAAPATQQMNPFTPPSGSMCLPLSVNNPPVAPPVGYMPTDSDTTYALGLSQPCLPYGFADTSIIDGPNSGYSYYTSATNQAEFDWVGAQDILNASSGFYGKQCGNYNASTNAGFISGVNLSANLIRHESSPIQGQGHYGNYVAAQNLSSNNIGTFLESFVVFGSFQDLEDTANPLSAAKQSAILDGAGVEPPEPYQDGLGNFLGYINYPPYASPTATPTCP